MWSANDAKKLGSRIRMNLNERRVDVRVYDRRLSDIDQKSRAYEQRHESFKIPEDGLFHDVKIKCEAERYVILVDGNYEGGDPTLLLNEPEEEPITKTGDE